jgi:hypothetical protein
MEMAAYATPREMLTNRVWGDVEAGAQEAISAQQTADRLEPVLDDMEEHRKVRELVTPIHGTYADAELARTERENFQRLGDCRGEAYLATHPEAAPRAAARVAAAAELTRAERNRDYKRSIIARFNGVQAVRALIGKRGANEGFTEKFGGVGESMN